MFGAIFLFVALGSSSGIAPDQAGVPLGEFEPRVGACPFVNGPANLREAPGQAARRLSELTDFERVKILEISLGAHGRRAVLDDEAIEKVAPQSDENSGSLKRFCAG